MTETETITLTNDGDLDVRFEGHKLGAWSSRRSAMETPSKQGEDNRWTELHVYWRPDPNAGKNAPAGLGCWIVQEIGVSQWQGEVDRHTVHVADTDGELVEALGTGRLAKEVYHDLGIDAVREV